MQVFYLFFELSLPISFILEKINSTFAPQVYNKAYGAYYLFCKT